MIFATPWAFITLLVIPLVLWLKLSKKKRASMPYSSAALAARGGNSIRNSLIRLPLVFRVLVLILLILALARPQEGLEKIFDVSRGVAIEMVVDRSGSMGAEMEFDGGKMNRLEVVKRVFKEFVNGNGDKLKGRPNDLIGMITFARYADTVCPLTLAHGPLGRFLDNVQLVENREEDGTAIGDALMLAAARLKTAEESLSARAHDKNRKFDIKSKIIVLLTDGENNAGSMPLEAAALAKKWGIKIYTIGVGGDDGLRKIQTMFGTQIVRTGRGVDRKTLTALAEETGGIFRMAEDGEALRAVYEEINRLEASEVESIRYMDYREFFTGFALAALALLTFEIILSSTVLRTAP